MEWAEIVFSFVQHRIVQFPWILFEKKKQNKKKKQKTKQKQKQKQKSKQKQKQNNEKKP